MSHLGDLPPVAAILIAIFVVCGSSLALLGSIGLVRLKSFYQRLHAPTMSYSYGTLLIVLGSMAMFSLLEERPVVHELIIGVFMLITTPISLLMLGRAALRRDRDAKLGHDEIVPPRVVPEEIQSEALRDLSQYGEGKLDRGLLSPSSHE
ncbi:MULTISPECIES: monovalent cation/H(+) antiporter subunit G [Paracoccus]|jgi:multicomponent K+:H+ antiporter subunit G|uniref:Cation:proton antiporter n=1 Tax=Paracoccus litorisediminis TaxID=2006130 RepID=A0A844HLH9_9RHOB|nr:MULTISPECIES: monovalent cation/H(+) antiporter subunit G [Paracoccus]MBD9527967.1 cation:proton antiporter [Paracoccus sp. PAR01]MTH59868.1 cation:proton antiporter [Paracoccus litorisediminis]